MWSEEESDKDWVRCASWLVRCQVLSREHKSAQPNAGINDLAHALRDGVLICMLLNQLQARAINPKDFSHRPQTSQFLCIKNIKIFLQACKSIFGMSEEDLFAPLELFEMRNIASVMNSLSILSLTPVALASQIAPFTLYHSSESDSSNSKESYINLNDIHDDVDDDDKDDGDDCERFQADDINDTYASPESEDDIYGDLVALKNHRVSTLPKSKHAMCLKELVDTEQNYLSNCLKMLYKDFMAPLKPVFRKEDFDKIFFSIEKLRDIHQDFYNDLTKAVGPAELNPMSLTVADCFIMNKEKFLIYGEFCSNLVAAQELLDKLCLNPEVNKKVCDLQMAANEGRFRLLDLLSVPMQRVLKYHLLLKELIRHTDDQDAEKKSLQKALEETQDLSLCVNEVKRDNEALNAISMLQHSIEDLPPSMRNLKLFGRLQKDGELKVRFEKNSDKRHVFVFDQIIIICKQRVEACSYVSSIYLQSCTIDEAVIKDWVGMKKCGFTLRDRSGSEPFVFEILGNNKEENRAKWISAIKLAQDNLSPPSAKSDQHDFVMWSFPETTICDVCRKLLRGIFFQGYRCQVATCNMSVHKDCIGKAKDMTGPPTKVPPRLPSRASTFRAPPSPLSMPHNRGKVTSVSHYQGIPHPGYGRTPLTFERGEEIELLFEEANWLQGKINDRDGFFPRSCTRRLPQRASYSELSLFSSASTPNETSLPEQRFDSSMTTRNSDETLESSLWYAGEMSRDDATEMLASRAHGTYLIRMSVVAARKGEFALSINNGGQVKHMKVQRGTDNSFFLATCSTFSSVVDMVSYYQKNSLEKIFPEVCTTLLIPYKEQSVRPSRGLGYCRAHFDYVTETPKQLPLREGDIIEIISKSGEDKGWWKGNKDGDVGYFPYAYVTEID